MTLLLIAGSAIEGCCSKLGDAKPKVGDPCTKGTGACLDAKNQLACQAGKFVSIPCKGAAGCVESGTSLRCDVSGNETGDLCSAEDEGTGVCTPDGKEMVKCVGGKFRRDVCDGRKGCTENTCYTRIKVGDPCDRGKSDCADEKTELTCQAGKFIATPCKGPKGCHEEASQVVCDVSGNVAGDPCSTDDEGAGQCGIDRKTLVKCEKGKYAIEACTGSKGCVTKGHEHTCYGR